MPSRGPQQRTSGFSECQFSGVACPLENHEGHVPDCTWVSSGGVSRQEAMKMCVVLRTGKHEHLDSRAWTAAQKHVHFPLKTGTRFNFNIYSYWCLATPKYIKEVYCKEYPRSKHGVEDQQVKFLPRFYFHLCLGPLCHQLQH